MRRSHGEFGAALLATLRLGDVDDEDEDGFIIINPENIRIEELKALLKPKLSTQTPKLSIEDRNNILLEKYDLIKQERNNVLSKFPPSSKEYGKMTECNDKKNLYKSHPIPVPPEIKRGKNVFSTKRR